MKPLSSTPCVAPISLTTRPESLSACVAAWLSGSVPPLPLPSPTTRPSSVIVAGCPSTFTPCTVVDDSPTGSAPFVYRDSATEEIESIVTSPPRRRTPVTVDSACEITVAAPSNALDVTAFTPPLLKIDVSGGGASGAAGATPGSVIDGGSGNPVASPPGSGAMRNPVNIASVVAVPSSPTWECASPAWPYSWPSGLPTVTAPAVLGSVLKPSASATNGHVEFVHACTTGPNSGK